MEDRVVWLPANNGVSVHGIKHKGIFMEDCIIGLAAKYGISVHGVES